MYEMQKYEIKDSRYMTVLQRVVLTNSSVIFEFLTSFDGRRQKIVRYLSWETWREDGTLQ